MKKVLFLTLVTAIVWIPKLASADDLTINFGAGVFSSGINTLAETKVLLISYNQYFYDRVLFIRHEMGGFADNAGGGRSGSALAAEMLGINAENGVFYAQASAGILGLSNTDSYLGGHFQFTEEVSIGINGGHGAKVGIFYKHISSAGVYEPNVGRDLMGVQINIPLF